jgi:hemolysin III
MGTYRDYTELEEKLNFGSHLIGLLFFLLACPYLIFSAATMPQPVNIVGLIIYSIGLIAVFSTSSLYHYTKNRELKTKFRTLDHMAIYLLIGGTYTPVINKYITNPTGTIFLVILWGILIGGMVMKFFFMGRFKTFSIVLYVFLGCMVVFLIKPILENMPHDVFTFILLGGVTYLVGVIFYINKRLEYTHTLWHLFVLGASIFHFIAIFKIAA